MAFFTAILIVNAEDSRLQTIVNGWSTTLKRGERRNGIFLRAACANHVAALNLPEEEMYWEMLVDGAGHGLNWQHEYMLHFRREDSHLTMMPPGQ